MMRDAAWKPNRSLDEVLRLPMHKRDAGARNALNDTLARVGNFAYHSICQRSNRLQ